MQRYYQRVALQHFAFGLIIPISVIWKLQNGLTLTQVAVTEAITLIITLLAEVPAGRFADTHSNRASLVLGSFLHFMALLAMLNGGSIIIFAVAAMLSGAGWAFISGSDEAHMHDDYEMSIGNDFKKKLSGAVIVDETATLAGLLASSAILSLETNIRILFLFSTFIMLVNAIYSWVYLPKNNHKKLSTSDLHHEHYRLGLKPIIGSILVFIALGFLYENVRFIWQPVLKNIGIDISSFGLLYASLQITSILGGIAAAKIHYSRNALAIASGGMVLSIAGLITKNIFIVVGSLLLLQVFENIFRIMQSTYLNGLIAKNRATYLSMASLFKNATGALVICSIGLFASSALNASLLVLVIIKLISIIYIFSKTNKIHHSNAAKQLA